MKEHETAASLHAMFAPSQDVSQSSASPVREVPCYGIQHALHAGHHHS